MNILVKRTGKFLEFVLVAILVLLLLAVTFQKLSGNKDFFGYRIFTVATSSMVPNYNVGDTLLVKKVPIGEIKIGDAVTYKGEDKTVKDKIITHRVEKIERDGGELVFHTKGIANNIEDPLVYEHQILGKVTHKFLILSIFGKIAYNVYLLFMFITVPLAILITMEIVKVSKLSDEEEEDDEPTAVLPKIVVKENNKYGHGETPTELLPVIEGPRCHKNVDKTRAIPIVDKVKEKELEKTKVMPALEKTKVMPVVKEEQQQTKPVVAPVRDKKKVEPKRTPPRQATMPNRKKQKNSYKTKNKNRYVNVRTKKYRNSSEYYKKIRNNNSNNQ